MSGNRIYDPNHPSYKNFTTYDAGIIYCPYIPVTVSKSAPIKSNQSVTKKEVPSTEVVTPHKNTEDTRTQEEIDICNQILG